MTVAELTAKDAEKTLWSMYYKAPDYEPDADVDDDDLEYETEHWGELSYSLGRTMTWSSELSRHIDVEPGEDFNGMRVACVQDVGGEGQGETRYAVFSFTDETGIKYFRKDGYYASYDGTTWDGDFREVTPQERVVVFYE
jgi:hypothetical protein